MKEQIKDICRRHRVADLYVFGSRAGEVAALVGGRADSLQASASDGRVTGDVLASFDNSNEPGDARPS